MSLCSAERLHVVGRGGHRLACRILGIQHKQTAILTSGIGCGPVFMDEIARELARDHRVVYWDFRGHGDSDPAPPGQGYGIAEHADDVDVIVRTFARHGRPLMVGFSMGVQVHVEWTRRNRGCASEHVFMLGLPRNPLQRTFLLRPLTARATERVAKRSRALLGLMQPAYRHALRTPMTYLLARGFGMVQKGCPRKEFMEFVRFATDVPLDAYLRCTAGLVDHDGSDVFAEIEEPVLMLAAGSDIFVSAEECRGFAAQLPNGRFELLQRGSHAGTLEYGVEVAQSIRRFVESQRSAVGCAA